jgi:hypothetical protein
MKEKKQKVKTAPKASPKPKASSAPVAPETDMPNFEDDFNRAMSTALKPEEFLQEMYNFVDTLPWDER